MIFSPSYQDGYNTVKLLGVVSKVLARPRLSQLQKSMMNISTVLLLFTLGIVGQTYMIYSMIYYERGFY